MRNPEKPLKQSEIHQEMGEGLPTFDSNIWGVFW